jgi:hypothetical protein
VKVAHVERSPVAEHALQPSRARAPRKEEEPFHVSDDDAETEREAKPEGAADDSPGEDSKAAARAVGLSPELCAWLLPLGGQTLSARVEERPEGSAHDPGSAIPLAAGDSPESKPLPSSPVSDAEPDVESPSPTAESSEDLTGRDPSARLTPARSPTFPQGQEDRSELIGRSQEQEPRAASSNFAAQASALAESVVSSTESSAPVEATPALSRGADSLTSGRSLTPGESAPDAAAAAAARARLQDAVTSSVHQRTLRDVAHGELTVPGLGHVAVTAHASRDIVDVEIRAAQASTAHALHARADALAADIRAADITVSRLAFEGAGTWTPSHDTASAHREGTGERPRGEPALPGPTPDRAAPRGRVRFVL